MSKIATYGMLSIWCLLGAGCGFPQPVATLQEFTQAQSKSYDGLNKKQIYQAIEEMFTLADPHDVRFTFEDNKLVVRRLAFLLLSVYEETWIIQAEESNQAIEVTVSVDPKYNGTSLPPTGVGPYKLFFARLDYLLHQSDEWMTCYDYETAARAHPTWGRGEEILCYLADDNLPEALRPTNTAEM